ARLCRRRGRQSGSFWRLQPSVALSTSKRNRRRLAPGRMPTRVGSSFLEQRIALLDQSFKLFSLLRDPVRVSGFILGAGECSGLFNQLPDVVTNNRDAPFEFRERKRTTVAHDVSRDRCLTNRTAWHRCIHSILTCVAWMTSRHLAESFRNYSAKAASAPGTGCTAKRSRFIFWNSESLTIFCTSALTFSMMCAGVPAAANSPNDTLASYPGTVSAMVGTSGNCGRRFSLPKASILSFPSCTELSATDGPIIT